MMQSMKELMEELGFREGSSQTVQEAFIKNLIRSAYGVEVVTPSEKQKRAAEPQQLSFDFSADIKSPEKRSA